MPWSQKTGWTLTWNNYGAHLHTSYSGAVPPVCGPPTAAEACDHVLERLKALPHYRFCCFQLELGDSGTPHVQGYVQFKRQVSPVRLIAALPGVHVEERRKSLSCAIVYCQKDDTRLPGTTFTIDGDDPRTNSQGSRTDLAAATEILRNGGGLADVAEEMPAVFVKFHRGLASLMNRYALRRPRKPPVVTFLYGLTGIGKSRAVWEAHPRLYNKSCDAGWFDGYDGEPVILLDEYSGELTLRCLLMLLDRYPVQMPYKGGFHCLNTVEQIFITSNTRPNAWYRWCGREAQYSALARRIHFVYAWSFEGDRFVCDHDLFFGTHPSDEGREVRSTCPCLL